MFKKYFSKADLYFALLYLISDLLVLALESSGNIVTLLGPTYAFSAAYPALKGFKSLPIVALCAAFIHTPMILLHMQNLSFNEVLLVGFGTVISMLFFAWMFAKFFNFSQLNENIVDNFARLYLKFLGLTLLCCIPPATFSYIIVDSFGQFTEWQNIATTARYVYGIFISTIILSPILFILFGSIVKNFISFHHYVTYALSIITTTGALYFIEVSNVETLESLFKAYAKKIEKNTQANTISLVDSIRQLRNNLHLYSEHGDDLVLKKFIEEKLSKHSFIENVFLATESNFKDKTFYFKTYKTNNIVQNSIQDSELLNKIIAVSVDEFTKYTAFFAPLNLEKVKSGENSKLLLFIPFERPIAVRDFHPFLVGIVFDFNDFIQSSIKESSIIEKQNFNASLKAYIQLKDEVLPLAFTKDNAVQNIANSMPFTSSSNFEYLNLKLGMQLTMPAIPWNTSSPTSYWWLLLLIFIFHIGFSRMQFYLILKDQDLSSSVNKLKSEITLREIAQKQIKNLNLNLESRVKNRTLELSERTKELEMLFNIISDALVKVNKSGQLIKIESYSEKSLDLNEFLDKGSHLSNFLKTEDKEVFFSYITDVVNHNIIQSKIFQLRENDKLIFCEFSFAKFSEDCCLIVIKDITEKYKLERQVEQQNLQALSHSKLASLGEMAAGIAHEINNPLTIIGGSAEVLKKLIQNDKIYENAKANNALERIHRTVIRIAAIVNGLKKYTHENKNDFEKVDLSKFLDESLSFCRERFLNQGVDLEIVINSKQQKIYCNPIELSQVFVNLLNNAYDAAKLTQEKWVKVIVSDNNEYFVIKVIDSGRGIAKDIEEKIMHPFYTTKAIGQGTGLGLSISLSIIKSHHGDLSYQLLHEHTCFTIKIPRNPPTSPLNSISRSEKYNHDRSATI